MKVLGLLFNLFTLLRNVMTSLLWTLCIYIYIYWVGKLVEFWLCRRKGKFQKLVISQLIIYMMDRTPCHLWLNKSKIWYDQHSKRTTSSWKSLIWLGRKKKRKKSRKLPHGVPFTSLPSANCQLSHPLITCHYLSFFHCDCNVSFLCFTFFD